MQPMAAYGYPAPGAGAAHSLHASSSMNGGAIVVGGGAGVGASGASLPPPSPLTGTHPRRAIVVDAGLTFGTLALAICLASGAIVEPRPRVFSPSDVSIANPFIGEGNVAVSKRTLAAIVLGAPLLTVFAVDGLLRRTTGDKTLRRMLSYVFGGAGVLLACAVLQVASGALTPDFFQRCRPSALAQTVASTTATGDALSGESTGVILFTTSDSSVCQGPRGVSDAREGQAIVMEGKMSFPNTVSALCAYGMVVTAVYVRNHFTVASKVLPVLIQWLAIGGGLYCAASQYSDYRASGVDVLAGLVLGTIGAAHTLATALGGLKRSFRGEDGAEVAEFLAAHSRPLDDPGVVSVLAAELRLDKEAEERALAALMVEEGGGGGGGGGGVNSVQQQQQQHAQVVTQDGGEGGEGLAGQEAQVAVLQAAAAAPQGQIAHQTVQQVAPPDAATNGGPRAALLALRHTVPQAPVWLQAAQGQEDGGGGGGGRGAEDAAAQDFSATSYAPSLSMVRPRMPVATLPPLAAGAGASLSASSRFASPFVSVAPPPQQRKFVG